MSSLPFEHPWVSKLRSPIPDIVDHNGFLKDESTSQVQTYLSALTSEKQSLEDAISRAKAVLVALERTKRNLEINERAHRAFICASRRCPPEIISLIMITSMELSRDDPPNKKRAPMLFCSVSKEWRYIATSTPRLWTNVVLNISPRNIEGKVELLEVWFERSKGNLLDVYLTDAYNQRSEILLGMILKESTRWRTARLKLQTYSLERIPKGIQLPKLQSLDFRSFYYNQDLYPTTCFANAPLLAEVTTSAGSPPFGWLNWENITHWSFDKVTTSDVVDLLCHARQLLECRVALMENRAKDPTAILTPSTTVLPHTSLCFLDITCPSSDELTAFCQHVSLTSLTSLRLSVIRTATRQETVGIPPPLEAFLLHCAGTLQSLELSKDLCAIGGWDGVLVKCLKKMGRLSTLRLVCRSLSRPSLDDKFLEVLTVKYEPDAEGSEAVILPNLEELRLQGVLGFTTDSLIAMVRSRGYPDASEEGQPPNAIRLKRLRVDIDTPFIGMKPKTYDELVPLREEGLNVVAMCRGKRMW